MSSINGGRRNMMSSVDFYRRVPTDLTEATALGAFMSLCAIGIMGILFVSETWAFVDSRIVTSVEVDENTHPQIRLNFNITLLDLHCDYVSVDVWDSLGTNRQNVTKNIDKWWADGDGVKRVYAGRNRDSRELLHDEHDMTLEEMHEEHGSKTVDLTEGNFQHFLEEHEMAFVDMFAPWCVWCQRLAPTWETMSRELKEAGLSVGVGKIDCVAQANLCRNQRIVAFPTLRWFEDGVHQYPDYKMDRTVQAMVGFVKRKVDLYEKTKKKKNKDPKGEEQRKLKRDNLVDNSKGCMVSGHLMVNRVPGNFHIEASSKSHNINAAMTNLTHIVNHLSFGDPIDEASLKVKRILKQVPEEHKKFAPMDGESYLTTDYHQAFHHYIKVVSTHLNIGSKVNELMTYQFIEQAQIVNYGVSDVPEARFSYDLSPMSVVVEKEGIMWYDYLTSLCAIIGGTFTTLGLIDATLYRVLKPKKL